MQRRQARENVFFLLFEKYFKKEDSAEEIFNLAVEQRQLETDDFVKKVFFGVNENAAIIEKTITENSTGWNIERISAVSVSILKLATYEMLFMDDIPTRVSINEAIELTKKYDDDKAYSFVNGVLNAISKKL